ncbi:MAG: hypothetical protein ACT4P5_23780, partial [Armatimonadota bacterium]
MIRSVKKAGLKSRLRKILRGVDALRVAAAAVWCREHLMGLYNWAGARILLMLAAVGVLALTLVGSAQAVSLEFFRLPSGNIGCLYFHESSASLRCDIRTGLKPKP